MLKRLNAGGCGAIIWCPSRVHHGAVLRVAASPANLADPMSAGMDRYFQIVKCFRDEDLRADRQAGVHALKP